MTGSSDWVTLQVQVTTPLFNGGADPDGSARFRPEQEAGVRVASLRGVMRFWFRALAGCATGQDLALLAEMERRVFGSADNASPVTMRLPEQPPVRTEQIPDFLRGEPGKWISYLLGQGLTKYDRETRRTLLTRPYVAPGEMFKLRLRFTDDDAGVLACGALWLSCAYGGVGARARRGFGGLRIIAADGPLPGPWNEQSLLTPGLSDYEQLRFLWPDGPLGACMLSLSAIGGGHRFDVRGAWAEKAPSFPVLSRTWTRAATSGGDTFLSWQSVLAHAGEQYRHFRASEPNNSPQARYQPRIKTPEWTDAVTGPGDHFVLGALGLPVGFKEGYVVNADRGLGNAAETLRRASPLWLRAVGSGSSWRLLSFAFRGEFLPGPQAPQVHLWSRGIQGKELRVAPGDIQHRTDRWMDALAAGESFADERDRR